MTLFKTHFNLDHHVELLRKNITLIKSMSGENIIGNYDDFSEIFDYLIKINPKYAILNPDYYSAIKHGFAYYYWRWDNRAIEHYDSVVQSLKNWSSENFDHIDIFCDMLDFFFFIIWCFSDSSTKQCQLAIAPIRAASNILSRSSNPRKHSIVPESTKSVKITWLSMFADSNNPMSSTLMHAAEAVGRTVQKFSVYAWRSHDDAFLSRLRDLGCDCHVLNHDTPSQTIEAIQSQLSIDSPHVIISDMNNAIPTVLFSRRVAPVQIFLQAGMPAWPIRNLDAVFNSFGIAPRIAGWGDARMLDFSPPWDLSTLNQLRSQEIVSQQRARLPRAAKLIGSYGRLVKVTRPYLEAAERILETCPDVAFIVGGTGNDRDIRAFIAASPVGDRMHVESGWVDGHVWGRLIDVFLDTWPVTGGESSREMIAKGRPVVTLHSEEMPAINAQRDPALVAANWHEFCDTATRLLLDRAEYAAACGRSRALAEQMSDKKAFAKKLTADISAAIADTRRQPARFRFWRTFKR